MAVHVQINRRRIFVELDAANAERANSFAPPGLYKRDMSFYGFRCAPRSHSRRPLRGRIPAHAAIGRLRVVQPEIARHRELVAETY
jgi:hypothetical protein